MRRTALALGAILPLAAPAQAPQAQTAARAELASLGRRVADTWCANCHVTGRDSRGPVGDAAPPFAAIARLPSTTEMSLRAFLQTPHARMPDCRLSQVELDSVVAYILSLKHR